MRSTFALVNADTFGFSRRARGGRTVKPEMPTMRQSSSSRYSVSVVSSVRQTMRLGKLPDVSCRHDRSWRILPRHRSRVRLPAHDRDRC